MVAGLPWSWKNIWKMKYFPGQGKVREFCGWSGKLRKDLESQGKVRERENKWLLQADFRKFIYTVQEGKRCPLGSKFFPLRVTPKFEVIQLAPLN